MVRPGEARLDDAMHDMSPLIAQHNQQQEHLQTLPHVRTRLLAAISHDFRQPLLAIRLYRGLLQQGYRLTVAQDSAN